jgi:hypothetical protein
MSPTNEIPPGGSIGADPSDAVRAALADALGTTEIDIVAGASGRMPDGREVRLFHGAVPGEPNRTAQIAADESGAVHPRRGLEALAGRDLFVPIAAPPAASAVTAARAVEAVTVDPPTNVWRLPECVTERETVTVGIPASRIPPKADVYLLADTTGSMGRGPTGGIIGAVQAGIVTIVNDPAFAGFDVAWGAGNYKDFPLGAGINPYAFEHQLAPTLGVADVSAAVTSWLASDGSDIPEGQLFALEQIATDPAIGWRPDSKRIVVWFGDAPGHDPVCSALTGLADITEATATAALVGAGITLVAVSTDTGTAGALDGDPTAGSTDYGACTVGGSAGQATRMTAATPGGTHTAGINEGQIVTTLVDLIRAAVQSIGEVHLQPTGPIAQFVTSITPPSYGPLPGDVSHILPFGVIWTGVRDCEDEDQVFTGTLDVVADGVVVATKPVTVTVPACLWHHSVEMICGVEDRKHGDDHGGGDECETVVEGRYATAVTIYNPTTCAVTIVKYFAPLVLHGKAVGREPRTVRARPFAKIVLEPGEATMDDCCSLEEAVGPTGGPLVLGVLDVVADHPLEVTVTHTAAGAGRSATSIDARTIVPRRA